MGKHTPDTTGSHAEQSGRTANTQDEYIGRHRERTEVRDDAQGWSVGRGVPETHER